jgi:hypothetical protein
MILVLDRPRFATAGGVTCARAGRISGRVMVVQVQCEQ